MGKIKDLRTKSEIKWYRHYARQQRKRNADGDTRHIISVKDDDLRRVIDSQEAVVEDTRLVVLSSANEAAQAAPEPEVDADDAISVHAGTDDELII